MKLSHGEAAGETHGEAEGGVLCGGMFWTGLSFRARKDSVGFAGAAATFVSAVAEMVSTHGNSIKRYNTLDFSAAIQKSCAKGGTPPLENLAISGAVWL